MTEMFIISTEVFVISTVVFVISTVVEKSYAEPQDPSITPGFIQDDNKEEGSFRRQKCLSFRP